MAAEGENDSILKFAQFQSSVDEGFWHRLSSLKLNKFRIDDSPIPISGFYAPCSHPLVPNHLTLVTESLPADEDEQSALPAIASGNRNRCSVPGTLYNTNTLEDFRALDKKGLLQQEANKIWEDIQSGKAMEDPAVLSRFLLISFADLKKWSFHYWFAFPALPLDPPATVVELKPASQWFTVAEAESVSKACNEWRSSNSTAGMPFFLVSIASDSRATVRHLKHWEACQGDGQKVLIGFYDPCNRPSNPGWPLRNLLALICSRWNLESVDLFCYRESRGFADLASSLVVKVLIPGSTRDHQDVPNATGWEHNKGRAVPRCINLATSMDPIRLVTDAADLNLKLMRWRALPSLDLEKLASMKCLLLGAGTLGCQVARSLMTYGIRKMTLLDNGKVAMSNPLRQSLYTYEDCLNGGNYKALAAAKALERIFPPVEAEGIVMSIPMPGHPVTSQEVDGVVDDCTRLHNLIDSHDAVFLLTDTRESRWLPTLLCANANKIAITAALGFDSFLVMRHGPGPFPNASKTEAAKPFSDEMKNLALADREKQRLGCYFCNDVVQPTDSTSNRTLDQQCTVTRPGLSPTSGSLAVELLANLLHHPDGIFAPANAETPLGILPHQIRSYLHDFSQMKLEGRSFDRCTACCSTVVKEYRKRGMEFLLQAINHPTYLADLTGLTELTKAANSFDIDWDDDDIGDDDELAEI